jgi:hypothetical protein
MCAAVPTAASENRTLKQRDNKTLHPTAYARFVPHFASAAGELGR